MKTNLLPWEDLETYMTGLERTGVYIAPGQTGEVNSIFDRELTWPTSARRASRTRPTR